MTRLTTAFAVLFAVTAAAGDYTLDKEHTMLNFEVAHLKFSKVRGSFNDFTGGFKLDDKGETLVSFTGTTKASSIDTNNEKRDKHLRSPDFFDADKFPVLKAEATGLKIAKGATQKVDVSLTIRDITKKVSFEVTFLGTEKDPWGTEKAAVTAVATIERKDFGLTWNQAVEAGGFLVGDKVKLELSIEGNKK